jgi:hypothetical protein
MPMPGPRRRDERADTTHGDTAHLRLNRECGHGQGDDAGERYAWATRVTFLDKIGRQRLSTPQLRPTGSHLFPVRSGSFFNWTTTRYGENLTNFYIRLGTNNRRRTAADRDRTRDPGGFTRAASKHSFEQMGSRPTIQLTSHRRRAWQKRAKSSTSGPNPGRNFRDVGA